MARILGLHQQTLDLIAQTATERGITIEEAIEVLCKEYEVMHKEFKQFRKQEASQKKASQKGGEDDVEGTSRAQ